MSIYRRKLSISLPVAILLFSLGLLGVFGYLSIKMTDKGITDKEGPMWLFAVGLVPGLAVALVQFLLSWREFAVISKFNAMDIKGVLGTRDEAEFYAKFITKARKAIQVEGVTASRFMSDFADEAAIREEKKVLISALERGVIVQILVAEQSQLSVEDQLKFATAEQAFRSLVARFPNRFEVKYFDRAPISSIVRVDDDILVGPVFGNIASRNTPAIHTSVSSPLAQSYLKHFDAEWSGARSI